MKATTNKATDIVEQNFIDDYQHYPRNIQDQKSLQCKSLVYSISRVQDCWEEMLVEECEATIPKDPNVVPSYLTLKNSWLETVLKSAEIQMHGSVRDYVLDWKTIDNQLKWCRKDPAISGD